MNRILGGVVSQFGANGLGKINIQVISQLDKIDCHISNFMGNLLLFLANNSDTLLGRLPLKMLQQFIGFDGNRTGQIFRVMELHPIARIPKFSDQLADLFKFSHKIRLILPFLDPDQLCVLL